MQCPHGDPCLCADEPEDDPDLEITAHRVASEVCRRWRHGYSLGRPSLYNIVREVLIDHLSTPRSRADRAS